VFRCVAGVFLLEVGLEDSDDLLEFCGISFVIGSLMVARLGWSFALGSRRVAVLIFWW
jgi:hypothetical protein